MAAGEREAEEAEQEAGPECGNPTPTPTTLPPGLQEPGQGCLSWLTRPACAFKETQPLAICDLGVPYVTYVWVSVCTLAARYAGNLLEITLPSPIPTHHIRTIQLRIYIASKRWPRLTLHHWKGLFFTKKVFV